MNYFWIIAVFFLLLACDSQRVHEYYHDLPQSNWYADSVVSFGFEVSETALPHHIFYNIRYTPAYPYYNLYVEFQLSDSTGKVLKDWTKKDINLMHPETGVPLGTGVGNFFDQRASAFTNFKFPYRGKYFFKIRQFMRQDTLKNISAIGIRVEKQEP